MMSFGSITFAIAVFFCINAYVTAELCEQSHGPFVTYDAQRVLVMVLFYALWTAVFRFWFRLCAVNTFTLFASWDAMEAAYLLSAYVSGASSLFPANWVLALGCGIALTSGLGQFMGVSRNVTFVSLCGLLIASFGGSQGRYRSQLLRCLDDNPMDQALDFLIWVIVTGVMALGGEVVGRS